MSLADSSAAHCHDDGCYTITQTTTTVRHITYTAAEVRSMLRAHQSAGCYLNEDLGESLRAAVLDATAVADQVAADAEVIASTSEYDVIRVGAPMPQVGTTTR
ncbi:hypothetical protein [Mycolicibacterium iranicum]|uniref:Uncharacterized protein n=1 Tax=Mycolicibacterium iranicum TaxID=912594 RepID=A0ABT4HKY8_MYCIR|nr:hypothetical protein [Mycolicibacterium iranicum]MCZ0730744.1 hypothetical protein [Mycolicibacterium iranicum]